MTTTVLYEILEKFRTKLLIKMHITTQEFNRLTAENFKERLKQTDLVSKNNFDDKRISFSKASSQNI